MESRVTFVVLVFSQFPLCLTFNDQNILTLFWFFDQIVFLSLQFLVDLVICSRSCNYKSLMNFVLRYVLVKLCFKFVYFVMKMIDKVTD